MNILVFDTETTDTNKPFCYNIGYIVYDTDNHEILLKRDFVIEQIWHNLELFVSAYYAEKRELYISKLKGKKSKLEKFGYTTQTMYRDIKQFEINHAYAYNSSFDERVFQYNCDWFKCINPLDIVQVHDIRGQVHDRFAFAESFQNFCDKYELYTESGNYSTTAENVYRFITNNENFVEEHTALEDSLIELEILIETIKAGADWVTDYKVYTTIPRKQLKQFTIIDRYGTEHNFDYTNKRKITDKEGFRLSVKE